MNKKQSNKYNSYVKLKGVLLANATIYESIAIFKQNVEKFLSLLTELLNLNSEHTHDTTPVTDAKSIAKEKTARLTSELAAAASAWAHEQNNPVLTGQFDYSYSDIRYARDNEASSISMSVLEELKGNASELAEYMISEQDTATLEGYINEFAGMSETRGAVTGQSVSETRKIAELFAGIDNILTNKLDRFMKRMERSQPDFYTAYMNARNIIDL